jgi:hypothetical protein
VHPSTLFLLLFQERFGSAEESTGVVVRRSIRGISGVAHQRFPLRRRGTLGGRNGIGGVPDRGSC